MRDKQRQAEDNRLVEDYLRRLRRAARSLPRARRQELLAEIEGHIAEARVAGRADHGLGARAALGEADSGGTGRETAEDVPTVLARLGDPQEIVREAGAPALASRPGGLEIAALILLLVGGFLAGVGWVAGVVLLWASPRWRWPDKLLGTLVWPGGLALPFFAGGLSWAVGECGGGTGIPTACTSPGPAAWVVIPVL
ncbi:MAG TPA: hypothetical protein VIV12_12235, partial [Streptosporangiaceae bacterium]